MWTFGTGLPTVQSCTALRCRPRHLVRNVAVSESQYLTSIQINPAPSSRAGSSCCARRWTPVVVMSRTSTNHAYRSPSDGSEGSSRLGEMVRLSLHCAETARPNIDERGPTWHLGPVQTLIAGVSWSSHEPHML